MTTHVALRPGDMRAVLAGLAQDDQRARAGAQLDMFSADVA
jgi:hypothetical protein